METTVLVFCSDVIQTADVKRMTTLAVSNQNSEFVSINLFFYVNLVQLTHPYDDASTISLIRHID